MAVATVAFLGQCPAEEHIGRRPCVSVAVAIVSAPSVALVFQITVIDESLVAKRFSCAGHGKIASVGADDDIVVKLAFLVREEEKVHGKSLAKFGCFFHFASREWAGTNN